MAGQDHSIRIIFTSCNFSRNPGISSSQLILGIVVRIFAIPPKLQITGANKRHRANPGGMRIITVADFKAEFSTTKFSVKRRKCSHNLHFQFTQNRSGSIQSGGRIVISAYHYNLQCGHSSMAVSQKRVPQLLRFSRRIEFIKHITGHD